MLSEDFAQSAPPVEPPAAEGDTGPMTVELADGEGVCVVCDDNFEDSCHCRYIGGRYRLGFCIFFEPPNSAFLKSHVACPSGDHWDKQHSSRRLSLAAKSLGTLGAEPQTVEKHSGENVESFGNMTVEFGTEDVEFPVAKVSMQHPDSGKMIEIEKPVGFFCSKCQSGCRAGFPYLAEDVLKENIETSSVTKALCLKVVTIHAAKQKPQFNGRESVQTRERNQGIFSVRLAGYSKDDFPDSHKGLSPDDLFIEPRYHKCDVTGEIHEVFWTPGKPQYEMLLQHASIADLTNDEMQRQVYQEQPAHTFSYLSGAPLAKAVQAPGFHPYASRAEFEKAVNDAAANKPVLNASPTKHGSVGGTVGTANAATSPFARQPVSAAQHAMVSKLMAKPVESVAPKPQAAKPPVKFVSVKTEPGVPTAEAGKSQHDPSAAKAPPSVKLEPHSALSIRAGDSAVVAPSSKPGPATAKRSMPPSFSVVNSPPTASRQKLIAPVGTKNLGSLPGNQGVLDLARSRQRGSADAESVTDDGTKSMCKFERAIHRVNIVKILMGHNLESEISNLRKAKTIALRESPREWYPRLGDHESHAVGAGSLVLVAMMAQSKFKVLVEIAEALVDALTEGKLPKLTLVDLCLVYQAMQYLAPWIPKSDFKRFLESLELTGPLHASEYAIRCPTWCCPYFDSEDLSTGIVPSRVVNFLQAHVIVPQITAGPTARSQLMEILADMVLPKLRALPESYSAPCYAQLQRKCKGVLFIIGSTRGVGDSTIADVDYMKGLKDDCVLHALKSTHYTKVLLDSIYAVNAGEQLAYPQVLEWKAGFTNEGTADAKHAHIQTMAPLYPQWKLQCRPTSLPIEVHSPVLKFLGQQLDAKLTQASPTAPVSIDADDPECSRILKSFGTVKSLGWDNPAVADALQKLQPLAKALEGRTNADTIAQVCRDFDFEFCVDGDGVVKFSAALRTVVPAPPAAVRITKASDRATVASKLSTFGELCLAAWPEDAAFDIVSFVLDRCEVTKEPPLECPDANSRLQGFRNNLVYFRRLQGLSMHLALWKKMANPINPQIVEDQQFIEVSKKLIVYEKHFLTEFDRKVLPSDDVVAKLDETLQELSLRLMDFKSLFISNAEEPFRTKLKVLVSKAGGGAPDKKWHDSLKSGCSWSEFIESTKGNLRVLDKNDLIKTVRDADAVPHRVAPLPTSPLLSIVPLPGRSSCLLLELTRRDSCMRDDAPRLASQRTTA